MELFAFDKPYVDRLRDGEPSTQRHFVSYFGQILDIMLRARYLPPDGVDDVRQETLVRVIAILKRDGGIRQPERFGAFVNSICKNVLRERTREGHRTATLEEHHLDLPDKIVDLERALITEETVQRVREILGELKRRDRDLLRALFLEEKSKDEICGQFGVDREYLRVLLYRAKDRFRSSFRQEAQGPAGRTTAGQIR